MEMYAIRITPYKDITLSEVEHFINKYSDKYVIGEETEKNLHYHIVMDNKVISQDIYDWLETDKKGNTIYSQTQIQDLDKAISYAMKDGNYIISDYDDKWENYCKLRYEESFKKPKSYNVGLTQLYKLYQQGELSDSDLWGKIVKLRCQFDIPTEFYKIDALVRTQILKKDPDIIDILSKTRKFLS